MTDFKIKPVKEVIVTDLVQDDIENFLHICLISGIPNAIWVEGMIIFLIPAHASEKNAERFFEGYRVYEKVIFAKYPKYTKTAKWNGGNYELPLRNYQNFPRFKEFGLWIKSQPVWKAIPEKMT